MELVIASEPQPNSAWAAVCNIGDKTKRRTEGVGMGMFLVQIPSVRNGCSSQKAG
jgi:hypothetical protein